MNQLLPIAENTDVVTLKIQVGGERLRSYVPVREVDIMREVNRIPYARIVVADGDASRGDFPVSAEAFFVPGQEIVISAGYHGAVEPLFAGIVTKQRIGMRDGHSWLEVECRDVASKMTLTRRHRYFEDVTDSEAIAELLAEHDIAAELADTGVRHEQLLQYQATDWDFMLSRLEANGLFCAVEDGKIRSFLPALEDVAAATVQFGTNLYELDAETDARSQVGSITARAWDPAEQALHEIDATDPNWVRNGNLTAEDLVAATERSADQLWHGGALPSDALQAWADGMLLRSRVAGSCGRAKVKGFSAITLGQTIRLSGLGDRFDGGVLATGVRHMFAANAWTTDIRFGADATMHAERFEVSAPPAAALSPAVAGLQAGIVTAIADDPAGEHRIRVKFPVAGMDEDGVWARLATLDAGGGRGTYFRPEVNDEVVAGFFHDDPAFPVVLGMLHSSSLPPPEEAEGDNHLKGYTSRDGLKIVFDDGGGAITLLTPEGNTLVLSDGDGGLTLADQNGNKLSMTSNGITLSSRGAIRISAQGDLTLEGANAELKGEQELKAEGSASAAISSSGMLEISGSLVKIN